MTSDPQNAPGLKRAQEEETAGFLNALVRLAKPQSILETGGRDERSLGLARALQYNGAGLLTVLAVNREAYRLLRDKILGAGLNNILVKMEESHNFTSASLFDMAIFNSAAADREEEFFYAAKYLKDDALVAFAGCREDTPPLDDLPGRLEGIGVLKGQFLPAPGRLYIGAYKKPAPVPKRFVFCLSPGRSGTRYVTSLLKGIPGVLALHEPQPIYQSYSLALQGGERQARLFVEKLKLPWIMGLPGQLYIELSHYVAKGFLEAWLEAGITPDLIVLHRDARAVARSWYALGAEFHHDDYALKHMLHPDDKRPLFLKLPDWQAFDNYQLCYWYALESEARARHYKAQLAGLGVRIFETSIDGLAKGPELDALLDWLGAELNAEDRALIHCRAQMKVNDKTRFKNKARVKALETMDLEALEAKVRAAVGGLGIGGGIYYSNSQ